MKSCDFWIKLWGKIGEEKFLSQGSEWTWLKSLTPKFRDKIELKN